MTSDNWAATTINWYLSIAGDLVSEDHYSARLEICKECPSFGLVKIPGAMLLGCTECGCPASTKPRVRSYFSPTEFKKINVVCPLGKWQIVDTKF